MHAQFDFMINIYSSYVKRILDIVISLMAILISIPILLFIIVLLFISGHRSFFFIQKRIGYKDQVFNLIKIKTMTDEKDEQGQLLSDEKRLTQIGKLLRRTSLDELPQFLNILKGDMSLVGPRPLLTEYLPLYSEEQRKRHLVKPGITGLAQVNGRNAISWKQKFYYDVCYVQQVSFLLDIKIMLLTGKQIFSRKGINQPGKSSTDPFKG